MKKVVLVFLKNLHLCLMCFQFGVSASSFAYEPQLTSSKKICNSLLINTELEANQEVLKNTLLKLFMSDYPVFFHPWVTRLVIRSFTYYLSPPKFFNNDPTKDNEWFLLENNHYLGVPDYFRANYQNLAKNIKPFRVESEVQLKLSAEFIWNKIVTATEASYQNELVKKFYILNSSEIKEIKALVHTIDSNPKLKELIIEAIIDFFFQSSEFADLVEAYDIMDASNWGWITIERSEKHYYKGDPKEYIYKKIAFINKGFFENKPTLLDIAQFKEENISELLLEGVSAEPLSFESFQEKLLILNHAQLEMNSPGKISESVHEFRIMVHALNLLSQGNYERFQMNPLWVKLKAGTDAWVKSLDGTEDNKAKAEIRHEARRLNFQAIVYLGEQITLQLKLSELLILLEESLHEQSIKIGASHSNQKNEKLKVLFEQSKENGKQSILVMLNDMNALLKQNEKRTSYLRELLSNTHYLESQIDGFKIKSEVIMLPTPKLTSLFGSMQQDVNVYLKSVVDLFKENKP